MIYFSPSQPSSIGLELELQIVNEESLNLVDGIVPLEERIGDHPNLKSEFLQNIIEIASSPHHSLAALGAELREVAGKLHSTAGKLGYRLVGSGTHPFNRRPGTVTANTRYMKMKEEAGYLAHRQITYATHVHIGVESPDDMMGLFHRFRMYLPLLLAVSSNSPFWQGIDTRHTSYRHRVLAASRDYGLPPLLEDWSAVRTFFESAHRAGLLEDSSDVHWDLRLRPDFGRRCG